MTKTNKTNTNKILRHGPLVRWVHWLTAISIFVLIFSGIGQMPMYKRYMVSGLPGMAWTADYQVTLIIHYVGSGVLVAVAMFHLVLHFMRKEFAIVPKKGDLKESYLIVKAMFGLGKEPPSAKYLAEQRVAYAYIAFSIALLIITGMIKVLKNFSFMSISEGAMVWITLLHNVGMILIIFGIVAHLGAFIIKENRPLLPTMFTGEVSEEYVKHRHPIWYDELQETSTKELISPNSHQESTTNQREGSTY